MRTTKRFGPGWSDGVVSRTFTVVPKSVPDAFNPTGSSAAAGGESAPRAAAAAKAQAARASSPLPASRRGPRVVNAAGTLRQRLIAAKPAMPQSSMIFAATARPYPVEIRSPHDATSPRVRKTPVATTSGRLSAATVEKRRTASALDNDGAPRTPYNNAASPPTQTPAAPKCTPCTTTAAHAGSQPFPAAAC